MPIASIARDRLISPSRGPQRQQWQTAGDGTILFNLEILDEGLCRRYPISISQPKHYPLPQLMELVLWWRTRFLEQGVITSITCAEDLYELFFITMAAYCISYQHLHPNASVGEVVLQTTTNILPAATMMCNLHPAVVVFDVELSYFRHDLIMIPDSILYLEE